MKCLLTTAALLITLVSARAEIVYTNMWGQTYFSTQYFDFNNDGTQDFIFLPYSFTTYIGVEGNNRVHGTPDEYVSAFSYGGNPGAYTGITTTGSLSCEYFNGAGPKYMLFKLKVGANYYYGWVHMSVHSGYFSIFEYAWENTPNKPIVAGAASSAGIEESAFEAATIVFPNPASEQVTVQLPEGTEGAEIVVYSPEGTEITRTSLTTVSLADLPAGVYLVAILYDEERIVKHVVKT